jgi:hypothetical protein
MMELSSWLQVTDDRCGKEGLLQWPKGGRFLWGPLKGLYLLCESNQLLHHVNEARDKLPVVGAQS